MHSIRSSLLFVACAAAGLASAAIARAEVKLPSVFADHMVLQREMAIPVWGWAKPGTKVVVELGDAKVEGQAEPSRDSEAEAKWSVSLPAQTAGGPHVLKVTVGDEVREIQDVLIGEIWICSGQSNMEWTLSRSEGAEAAIAASADPMFRHFKVGHVVADSPQSDLPGSWTVAGPDVVGNWSAVAYFFGKKLREDLGVPVGLLNTSWGGTRSEAWARRSALDKRAELVPLLKWWDDRVDQYDAAAADARYKESLAAWEAAKAKAKETGQPEPNRPQPPYDPMRDQHRPAALYNAMIAPLVPYAVRGAIWYQGESNVPRANQYRTVFKTMIESWREDWGTDLPFYFVQLAPFRYGGQDPENLAELWEAQFHTMKNVPHTGMAVITDIGDLKDIHPTKKEPVGNRLALWALANDYDKDVVHSGPVYSGAKVDGAAVRVSFDHVGDGLKASDGEPLSDFQIAGEDGQFVAAKATVDGSDVVVSSPEVAQPKYVRFGWNDTAEPNFVNSAGLPASPFRTDELPAKTAEKYVP